MRTTLTLDEDVTKQLERLRKEYGGSFKTLVNDALREGLKVLEQPRTTGHFRTQSVSLGEVYIVNLDSIGDALETAEGRRYG